MLALPSCSSSRAKLVESRFLLLDWLLFSTEEEDMLLWKVLEVLAKNER